MLSSHRHQNNLRVCVSRGDMYIYLYKYTHIYIYIYIYICYQEYTYIYLYIHLSIYLYIYIYISFYTDIYLHECTLIYTYVYMFIYIYISSDPSKRLPLSRCVPTRYGLVYTTYFKGWPHLHFPVFWGMWGGGGAARAKCQNISPQMLHPHAQCGRGPAPISPHDQTNRLMSNDTNN